MRAEEIIEKLRPTLLHEGLEVDYQGQEGSVVNLRARRVAPGVPVAFLVKAIAGTFRRYMPEIEDVCLTEYDPGDSVAVAPSETFEAVFTHRPRTLSVPLAGIPVLDLTGLNRRDSVRALEGFVKVWKDRCPILGIQGLEQDAPYRAALKWSKVYAADYRQLLKKSDSRWDLCFDSEDGSAEELLEQGREEVMPGKIFLTESTIEEPSVE